MTPLTVLDKVVAALQAAGATEEMIAAAVGRLGSLGIPHRAPTARRASMPMRRHASARGSGVTKYITKFPRLTRRVTKCITKFSLPPIRVTKFETNSQWVSLGAS
jgi:hypothetical protein